MRIIVFLTLRDSNQNLSNDLTLNFYTSFNLMDINLSLKLHFHFNFLHSVQTLKKKLELSSSVQIVIKNFRNILKTTGSFRQGNRRSKRKWILLHCFPTVYFSVLLSYRKNACRSSLRPKQKKKQFKIQSAENYLIEHVHVIATANRQPSVAAHFPDF